MSIPVSSAALASGVGASNVGKSVQNASVTPGLQSGDTTSLKTVSDPKLQDSITKSPDTDQVIFTGKDTTEGGRASQNYSSGNQVSDTSGLGKPNSSSKSPGSKSGNHNSVSDGLPRGMSGRSHNASSSPGNPVHNILGESPDSQVGSEDPAPDSLDDPVDKFLDGLNPRKRSEKLKDKIESNPLSKIATPTAPLSPGFNPALDAKKKDDSPEGESLFGGMIDDFKQSIAVGPAAKAVRATVGVATGVATGLVVLTMVGVTAITSSITAGSAATISAASAIAASNCMVDEAYDSSESVSASSIEGLDDINIDGYSGVQLENAAYIARAASDQGMGRKGMLLGIMAAIGESSLRNIDYGDWETSGVTNPDGSRTTSIGLFQQQNSWGTVEERMDPYRSAVMFFKAMKRKVPNWAILSPTIAIHLTQVNKDPEHYASYEATARMIVNTIEDLSETITVTPAPDESSESNDGSNVVTALINFDSDSMNSCEEKSEEAADAISQGVGSCAPNCPGVDGPQDFDVTKAIQKGLSEVGTVRPTGWNAPGECIVSVRRWITHAGGNHVGGGVVNGYLNSPATLVTDGSLRPGDVIQYTSRDTPNMFKEGVHTYMINEVNEDGTINIVESNYVSPGKVGVRTNIKPSPPAGWDANVWRFAKQSS